VYYLLASLRRTGESTLYNAQTVPAKKAKRKSNANGETLFGFSGTGSEIVGGGTVGAAMRGGGSACATRGVFSGGGGATTLLCGWVAEACWISCTDFLLIGFVFAVKCSSRNLPLSGKLRKACVPVRFLPAGGMVCAIPYPARNWTFSNV